MTQQIDGGGPTRTIGAKDGEQTRAANGAGAGDAVEQIVFGVLTKQFGDALVEFLNGADEVSQLNGGSFNDQAVGFDDGRVGGDHRPAFGVARSH